MKITIDTKEDSHEELRKVIKMLSSLVGGEEVMSNQGDLFGDSSQSGSSDIFNGDRSSNDSSGDSGGSSEGSGGGVFNMFNSGSETKTEEQPKEEEKEEPDLGIPSVEEYE